MDPQVVAHTPLQVPIVSSTMTDSNVAALFGNAQTAGGDDKKKKKEFQKRGKLWDTDHAAAVQLNPFGKSGFDTYSNKAIFKMTADGSTFAKYHSNMNATNGEDDKRGTGPESEDYRVGIGISQTAQGLLAVIEQLNNDQLKALLKEEHLALAQTEAEEIKDAVKACALGKVGFKSKGITGAKRMRTDGSAVPTKEALKAASEKLYDFLNKANSPLKGLMELMAQGGVFWSGHICTKTAAAIIEHKPIPKEKFVQSILERAHTEDTDEGTATSSASALLGSK